MKYPHGMIILLFACMWTAQIQADAGFNIRRKQATVRVEFKGVEQLKECHLVYYRWTTEYRDSLPPAVNRTVLDTIAAETVITVNNARKFFDEEMRNAQFGLVDTQGNWVDSFSLYLKDFNYQVKLAGIQQNRLQYKLDSTPVVFEYALWNGDGTHTDAAYTRNRWIFIGASVLGLILLVAYSVRVKRHSSNSNTRS